MCHRGTYTSPPLPTPPLSLHHHPSQNPSWIRCIHHAATVIVDCGRRRPGCLVRPDGARAHLRRRKPTVSFSLPESAAESAWVAPHVMCAVCLEDILYVCSRCTRFVHTQRRVGILGIMGKGTCVSDGLRLPSHPGFLPLLFTPIRCLLRTLSRRVVQILQLGGLPR